MPAKDITNQKFGRLTVLGRTTQRCNHGEPAVWSCRCDCGTEVAVSGKHLRSGHTKSCGCLIRETCAKLKRTHGESGHGGNSREYRAWRNMIERCENPNHISYKYYGGRAISVCERWRESYEAFLADMGRCPPGLSLDRINNDGDYEPGNCRWATDKQQRNNRRQRATEIAADLR